MKLKQCPFWFIAGIRSDFTEKVNPYPTYSFKEIRTNHPNGLNCIGEKCQMWDETTKDCGLKRSNDLKSSQSNKDEHKQEEKQSLTPEERDLIHTPFSKDTAKFSQDPWTCPE